MTKTYMSTLKIKKGNYVWLKIVSGKSWQSLPLQMSIKRKKKSLKRICFHLWRPKAWKALQIEGRRNKTKIPQPTVKDKDKTTPLCLKNLWSSHEDKVTCRCTFWKLSERLSFSLKENCNKFIFIILIQFQIREQGRIEQILQHIHIKSTFEHAVQWDWTGIDQSSNQCCAWMC